MISQGPSGSDAESKSGSSLGSSSDSPFPSRSNSPPAFQIHEGGVLEKGEGCVFPMSVFNKEVIPLEMKWGGGRWKRGVELVL